MAGDWVKMRSSLLANPRVHAIAKAIGRDSRAGAALTTGYAGCPDQVLSRHALRHVTVTALLCVWSSANEHSADGVLRCCDLEDIDDIAGVPGLGEAMEAVGWAKHDAENSTVSLPNFNEHNTCAKDRTAAERQKRHRARNGCVTRDITRDVTRDVTDREEKSREEKNKDIPAAPVATSKPQAARSTAPKIAWNASGDWEGITDADRQEWATAFPGAVIDQELAKATAWLRANPAKAGKRNWRAFLVRWLGRCQDKGGTNRQSGARAGDRPPLKAWKDDYRPAPYRTPKEVAALAAAVKLKEEDL